MSLTPKVGLRIYLGKLEGLSSHLMLSYANYFLLFHEQVLSLVYNYQLSLLLHNNLKLHHILI